MFKYIFVIEAENNKDVFKTCIPIQVLKTSLEIGAQITYCHNGGCDHSPGPNPVFVGLISGHLGYAIPEFIGAKNPSNGNSLEEATPEYWNSRGTIKVH